MSLDAPAAAGALSWRGYRRLDLELEGRASLLVLPDRPAPGRPWIWRTQFFDHEPQGDVALLGLGLHVAFTDMPDLYGGPEAMARMDAFWELLVRRHGLSARAVLEGFSRGGLYAVNWAARHPDRVAALYLDAPVCDLRSWPAGRGAGPGSPDDWERCKAVYGLTEATASAFAGNPIDNLAPLAVAGIPILSVCGETDTAVPVAENTAVLADRYRRLGGPVEVISKPHNDHHPHSLQDPTRIVNFVLAHVGLGQALLPPARTPYGYEYHALRDGLAASRAALAGRGRGRVAFLGGSITAGPGWRELVCQDLQRRFPGVRLEFVNAGIPSFGSAAGAFRLERDVLAGGGVDLLFVEAAVNDGGCAEDSLEPLRGMEGIVRHARLTCPAVDIVLLHFADPGKIAQIDAGRRPAVIAAHERVAQHYGLPSIDLAREVAERIHAGEFTWAEDFRDLHPSPFGHRLYAESVARLLDAAWGPPGAAPPVTAAASSAAAPALAAPGADAPPAVAPAGAPPPHPLPEPLDRCSYYRGRLLGPAAAVSDAGWRLEPSWRPADGVPTRIADVPMRVCDQPGCRLALPFEGTAVGLYLAAGPDAGTVEYRIDGGPVRRRDLFTPWSARLHLNTLEVLADGLAPGPHELRLWLAPASNPASRGQAARIAHFAVG